MLQTKYFGSTISDIVKADYRTADVFRKFGINYCCGGAVKLEDVCKAQQLDIAVLENELFEAAKKRSIPPSLQFDEWSVDFLIDYIINIHHAYLRRSISATKDLMASFVKSHKNKYPYLETLQETYFELGSLLLEHMDEEEEKIFPYIKQMSHTHKHREKYGRLFVKNLSKPLAQVLQSDHKHIAAMLLQLRKDANNYNFEKTACTNHQVIFQKLQEQDADIVQHKHLENNFLFPKAIDIEKELMNL